MTILGIPPEQLFSVTIDGRHWAEVDVSSTPRVELVDEQAVLIFEPTRRPERPRLNVHFEVASICGASALKAEE